MADHIYSSSGIPQGFRLGDYIYDLEGEPIGKVFAEKAYTLEGVYVGLIVNNMVLDKPGVSRRAMAPAAIPPRATPPAPGGYRQSVCESYPDCFDLLLRPARSEPDMAGAPS
jgi:hypothetical protein